MKNKSLAHSFLLQQVNGTRLLPDGDGLKLRRVCSPFLVISSVGRHLNQSNLDLTYSTESILCEINFNLLPC